MSDQKEDIVVSKRGIRYKIETEDVKPKLRGKVSLDTTIKYMATNLDTGHVTMDQKDYGADVSELFFDR